MKDQEYEIIPHNNNFHLFLVNLLYRTPHIHKDYEICLVMDGAISLITPDGTKHLSQNYLFVMNPFVSHEITAQTPALILSLQLSPALFLTYYPQIENTEFDTIPLYAKEMPDDCAALRDALFQLSRIYFSKDEYSAIQCMILINQIFLHLLKTMPHHLVAEKEKQSARLKGARMRKIMSYIDAHYTEKILLSDIARQEGLDLYYLSHFFKDSFGITFQNYISKIRCEHARQLVLLTDYSLLDISLSCGFSDTKYFNKAFHAQYGCTPKQYRQNFQNSQMEQQRKSMLTTQEFLSDEASLLTLDAYTR